MASAIFPFTFLRNIQQVRLSNMIVEKIFGNEFSVSMTTRSPRPGEVHGKDYFFVTREEFESNIADGGFLEYATVFDNYYGTPKEMVMNRLRFKRPPEVP